MAFIKTGSHICVYPCVLCGVNRTLFSLLGVLNDLMRSSQEKAVAQLLEPHALAGPLLSCLPTAPISPFSVDLTGDCRQANSQGLVAAKSTDDAPKLTPLSAHIDRAATMMSYSIMSCKPAA